MTTYNSYKCSTCKRTTEIEVDPSRPSFTQCNITYKCVGKLQKTGTKSTREHLLSVPVAGLANWQSRHLPKQTKAGAVVPVKKIPISTGTDILTIAAYGVAPEVQSLSLVLGIKRNTMLPFRQYSYSNFVIPTSSVSGADSTPDKRIFRYAGAGENFDMLTVTLNGIAVPRAVRAQGIANIVSGVVVSVTIVQEGSDYDTPPQVIFGGNGSGAAGIATIANGVVTAVTITSAGNSYTGTVPVTFSGGVQNKTVYYSLQNEMQFEPPIPPGSKLDAIVTPYVESQTVNITFDRHNISTEGAWSNIKTISSDRNYDLFSCFNLDVLEKEIHIKPIVLNAEMTSLSSDDWYFVISSDPHEHVDRIYSLKLQPRHAELNRSKNILNEQDILVSSDALSPVYPPFSIVEQLKIDTNKSVVSNIDANILINPYVVGKTP